MPIARPVRPVHAEAQYTVVDVSANSTVVSAAPAILLGVWVNVVLSAHACPIKDGAVTVYSLAASAPVNTKVDFPGVRCESGITVDPDDAATGTIVVAWMPA
jgi:hypothetical protein